MPSLRPLLGLLLFMHFIAFVFVIIATAVTDWSKSSAAEYGIWKVCSVVAGEHICIDYPTTNTDNSHHTKDCNGALVSTRAFSVLSIIFVGFELIFALSLLLMPSLLKLNTILIYFCLVLITNLWLFLGWIMYLGVQARGQCVFDDYSTHLGSSWFLQLFAWIIELLITIPLLILTYIVWRRLPRFAAPPVMVPGPIITGAPVMTTYPVVPPMVPTAPAYPVVPMPPIMTYGPTPHPTPMVTEPMPAFPTL